MGTTRRLSRRWLVAAVALVTVVAGVVVWRQVTAPDLSPVPTVASGPYLCDGVPAEGAELILGGPGEVERTDGAWGSDEESFACVIERDGGAIDVYEEPVQSRWSSAEVWRDHRLSEEWFEADAPGSGYVRTDGPGFVEWVCGDRLLNVVISGIAPGRDKKADIIAFTTSMLPWACGGVEPPEADTDSRG